MAKEIHEDEIRFNPETPDVASERCDLTRGARHHVFVMDIYSRKSVGCIALQIFASCRCSQLFLVSCDIMFRNLFCIIITDDAYFEALLQHLPADFKSDSPGGWIFADIVVQAPCRITCRFKVYNLAVCCKSANLYADRAFYTLIRRFDAGFVKAVFI